MTGVQTCALPILSADGSLLRYLDATVAPGEQYRYRLALEGSQGTLYTSEVELNIPGLERMVLENALPNPARGEFSIAFTLADQTPTTLELLDLAGRVVVVRRLGSPEPGRHLERIGGLQALSPGIYFARLHQGEHTLVGRVAVVK